METCVRGFSFMSDNKVDLVDLQYIEGGELERAWRSSRRERMKQREQKIWDEFVKEKDVVQDLCSDDPYQFLDELPESCLKEIMETELQKMSHENTEEETRPKEHPQIQQGNGDNAPGDDSQHTCVVTFADDMDKDDCEMFHIFDDDQSGPEDEALNDSMSPSTVREKPGEDVSENQSPDRTHSVDKTSSKSSENVTNVIESSIYCAKVKDLRMKINEELLALMTSLDRRDILSAEPETIIRMIKRSAEFCMRFNRIHMYQLQRQIHDIKRHNSVSLPFAKHTQFQSQMVRIVSLHQTMLQSIQVLHKSFEQTCCVRESAAALGALVAAARDASRACQRLRAPQDFTAAADLYKDEMLVTCDKVDEFVSEYAIRCEEFLNSFQSVNIECSKKVVKNKSKKRSFAPWTKNNAKNVANAESRLSMYSLDTLRLNLNPKSTSSKDTQMGYSMKKRGGLNHASGSNLKRGQGDKNSDQPKSQRRSPGFQSRRPLMRDPHAGRPRPPRPPRETDIRTMVEAVGTCTSSHISREASPRVRKRQTPRRAIPSAAAPQHSTPRRAAPPAPPQPTRKHQLPALNSKRAIDLSAKSKTYQPSPANFNTTSSMKTDPETVDPDQVTPVCKIQCAMKKDLVEIDDGAKQGTSKKEYALKKSPTAIRVDEGENNDRDKLMESTNVSPKSPMTPVSKIQCAKKKDFEVDDVAKYGESSKGSPSPGRKHDEASEKKDRERSKMTSLSPDRFEVTRLLKQLCSGDASGAERITGAKNAQLLCVSSGSPRQPSTPQLLRILEETIQKKVPKPLFKKPPSARGRDRYRLLFNITDKTADTLFQYRTKFVQHMLASTMYANSAVGKPWEMIGSVSEQLIDELLLGCLKEMELRDLVQQLYKKETTA